MHICQWGHGSHDRHGDRHCCCAVQVVGAEGRVGARISSKLQLRVQVYNSATVHLVRCDTVFEHAPPSLVRQVVGARNDTACHQVTWQP